MSPVGFTGASPELVLMTGSFPGLTLYSNKVNVGTMPVANKLFNYTTYDPADPSRTTVPIHYKENGSYRLTIVNMRSLGADQDVGPGVLYYMPPENGDLWGSTMTPVVDFSSIGVSPIGTPPPPSGSANGYAYVNPRSGLRTSCEMMLRSRPHAQIGECEHASAPELP